MESLEKFLIREEIPRGIFVGNPGEILEKIHRGIPSGISGTISDNIFENFFKNPWKNI